MRRYLTVSGRGHPIEVRYAAPAIEPDETDLPAAVLEAYQDIATTPGPIGSGDVLVFLPGEREIRDVAELLERELAGRRGAAAVFAPVVGAAEQDFQARARAGASCSRPTSRRPRSPCRASAR